MTQIIWRLRDSEQQCLELPSPEQFVFERVRWGRADCLFTPAYWASQAWFAEGRQPIVLSRIGTTLAEQVAFCLLGGHGVTAEANLAAFLALQSSGLLFETPVGESALCEVLSKPLNVGGRCQKYRYPQKKSAYLSVVLTALAESHPSVGTATALRLWLLQFPGIGNKTASWIARDWLGSEELAVIDVHIHRAGLLMGLFERNQNPATQYYVLEDRFLKLAGRLNVRPSTLDLLMWSQMRNMGALPIRRLQNRPTCC